MNIAYLQNPVDVYCKVTAALPSTAVQAATLACETVALALRDGIFCNNASTSLVTAVATCGLAAPTAFATSACSTMLRLPAELKKPEERLLRLASRPVPKNASRSWPLAIISRQ